MAGAVVVAVLLAGVVLGVVRLGPGIAELAGQALGAGATEAGGVTAPAPAPVPTVGVAEGERSPPDGDAEGGVPRDDLEGESVTALLQQLVDGRAEAWEAGDPAALAGVLADGSPALEVETAALERAGEQQVAYEEVSFAVERAAVVRADDTRLAVDAVVTRHRLVGVDEGGQTVVDQPATTEEVRLELTRANDAAAWLLWSWEVTG